MVKWLFRLMEHVLFMVLYRNFLKMVLYSTKKDSATVMMSSTTVAERFLVLCGTIFKKVLFRTIHNTCSSNVNQNFLFSKKQFISCGGSREKSLVSDFSLKPSSHRTDLFSPNQALIEPKPVLDDNYIWSVSCHFHTFPLF